MITRRDFTKLGLSAAVFLKMSSGSSARDLYAERLLPNGEGVDVRRVGVRRNGAYWGAGAEKIDLLSGNLSYSIPLLRPKSRRIGTLIRLSYNSQVWRFGKQTVTCPADDFGLGLGWRLQIGAVYPERTGHTITNYKYIDATGAEYRLFPDQNNEETWISIDGHYLTWVANASTLYYPNGTSLTFGCVSGEREVDAGTLYPTVIDDSNGNQIFVRYSPGIGESKGDTSGRLQLIEDARAIYDGARPYSYIFSYDSNAPHRLVSIMNTVGSAEEYYLQFAPLQLSSPFEGGSASPRIISTIQELRRASGLTHTFQYNAYGELAQVAEPLGGILSWDYSTFSFQDGRSIREITNRSLSDPHSRSNSHVHAFERDPSDGADPVHKFAIVSGPQANVRQRWVFASEAGAPNLGLLLSREDFSSDGTVIRRRVYEWTRTTSGLPYVSTQRTILDPDANGATMAQHFQRDPFGNLLSHSLLDYGEVIPSKTTTHTYLAAKAYLDRHILNRLLTVAVTGRGETFDLISNRYDSTPLAERSGLTHHDSTQYGSSVTVRGNLTETISGSVYSRVGYDIAGVTTKVQDAAGNGKSYSPAEGTNNTLVGAIRNNSGNEQLVVMFQYDERGRLTVTSRPNGNNTRISYDSLGRRAQVMHSNGQVKNYQYANAPRAITVTDATTGKWKRTIKGGFGHTIRVETGDQSGTQSVIVREYGPAANAPHGKLQRKSLPHAQGDEAQWVTYTYDDIGRKTAQGLASTGALRTIRHSGNSVKYTDPAGRWRSVVHNAAGQITKVVMPGANGASVVETAYSYNVLGNLSSVIMPRGTGTQERRFGYDPAGLITMVDQPESGREERTYNSDGTLASIVDAKGQRQLFARDNYKRTISVKRYDSGGTLQLNDSYSYFYDSNPFDPSYSQNTAGRLAAVQWGSAESLPGLFTEMYNYTSSGTLTGKRMQLKRGDSVVELELSLSYDADGRIIARSYPTGGPMLSYTYDSMGRLNGVVSASEGSAIVKNVDYDKIGRLKSMQIISGDGENYLNQRYSYDVRNRISRLTVDPDSSSRTATDALQVDLEYRYRPDDGKLSSETDHIADSSVAYDYDSHGRLKAAVSNDEKWGLAFEYDDFSNRTAQRVTTGQGYSHHAVHDPATNWIIADDTVYDRNGNIIGLPGIGLTYDTNNRVTAVSSSNWGDQQFGYDSRNLRIWTKTAKGREILSFYEGTRKLASYLLVTLENGTLQLKFKDSNVYFGKRRVQSGGEVVVVDRLGAARAVGDKDAVRYMKYFPFGEEVTKTSDDRQKLGGYERDAASGLDYAEQRYYSSALGRFISPDPNWGSARPSQPDTWNRYAFVRNDPVNYVDPHGLDLNQGSTASGNVNGDLVFANVPKYDIFLSGSSNNLIYDSNGPSGSVTLNVTDNVFGISSYWVINWEDGQYISSFQEYPSPISFFFQGAHQNDVNGPGNEVDFLVTDSSLGFSSDAEILVWDDLATNNTVNGYLSWT